MKPNDSFRFVKNNQLAVDYLSLTKLYLPIIGREALALYQYLLAFWDGGQTKHNYTEILNHIDMGWQAFEKALDQLIALRLLDLYQEEVGYRFVLYPNLTTQDFFANHVYRRLLEQKIGEAAVEQLLPEHLQGQRRESSVLRMIEEQLGRVSAPPQQKQADFDLTHFKQVMARDGLRFADEKADLLVLFQIAESQKWTWYETYLLAKETAVSYTISTKRMEQKLKAKTSPQGEFSAQERTIIREAKAKKSLQFLAEIKQAKQANITQSERKTLQKMAELGLLDEVINVIMVLTFNKVNSANLNEKYALKVANDFSYQGITTAEQAVLRIRERNQDQVRRQSQQATTPAQKQNNVPQWSQPDYKNATSSQEQEEMERRRQELLAKLDKGGD